MRYENYLSRVTPDLSPYFNDDINLIPARIHQAYRNTLDCWLQLNYLA